MSESEMRDESVVVCGVLVGGCRCLCVGVCV